MIAACVAFEGSQDGDYSSLFQQVPTCTRDGQHRCSQSQADARSCWKRHQPQCLACAGCPVRAWHSRFLPTDPSAQERALRSPGPGPRWGGGALGLAGPGCPPGPAGAGGGCSAEPRPGGGAGATRPPIPGGAGRQRSPCSAPALPGLGGSRGRPPPCDRSRDAAARKFCGAAGEVEKGIGVLQPELP